MSGRAPGRGPEGTGNRSSCYGTLTRMVRDAESLKYQWQTEPDFKPLINV